MYKRKINSGNMLLAALAVSALCYIPNVNALMITLEEFTGDDARMIADVQVVNDNLKFTLDVIAPPSPTQADISGFYLDINKDSLLGGFSVIDSSVTVENFEQLAGGVNDLGGGVNIVGGGTPAPMDIGIRFNIPGDGTQTSVMFTLDHTEALSLDLFGPDEEFAARLQATNGTDGSSKLKGPVTQTEPSLPVPDTASTLILLGMSLLATELSRKKWVKS